MQIKKHGIENHAFLFFKEMNKIKLLFFVVVLILTFTKTENLSNFFQ